MPEFIKRFPEWLPVKSRLDSLSPPPPRFNEREVWWCGIGENVGIEISGKGSLFRRPVLILRKLDPYSFIGVPLTKTQRTGDWYQDLDIHGNRNNIILSQVRHFDYRRLDKIIYTVPEKEFASIINAFIRLFRK